MFVVTSLNFAGLQLHSLTLSLPESVKGDIKVILTFESVDEMLWGDHSNETSLAVISHEIWDLC